MQKALVRAGNPNVAGTKTLQSPTSWSPPVQGLGSLLCGGCRVVGNLLQLGEGRNGHGSHGLVLHIMKFCNCNWSVSLKHVHREGNRVADQMSKFTGFETLEMKLFHEPPQGIEHLLEANVGD
ncbi:hypothetical protein V6N11_051904 [Hibiscus sabdariffa]|uniref:RNase H type-1 domain-containing protein n=1 Tax=Hibiscus sabdariffa TaxID=183260 RepID=A0ABR2U8D4_9ROSI